MILETGESAPTTTCAAPAISALEAGADIIKTSTGKVGNERDISGCAGDVRGDSRLRAPHRPPRGFKVAGGCRTTKQALTYLVIVKEMLGEAG